jgi:hypothetical protein
MSWSKGQPYVATTSTSVSTGIAMSLIDNLGNLHTLTPDEQFTLCDFTVSGVSAGDNSLLFLSSTLSTYPVLVVTEAMTTWHTGAEGISFPPGTAPWFVNTGGGVVIATGTGYITPASAINYPKVGGQSQQGLNNSGG